MSRPARGAAAFFAALAPALLVASTASAEEPKPPRTIAFVVGIEHYADPDLDKLVYAADDARSFFERLRVVTDLDPKSVLLVADDADGSRIDADRLRTELQKFVRQIKDRMSVVVYLGGHGTHSPSKRLWYLPSNYSVGDQTGYVPFEEIRNAFKDSIDGKQFHRVDVSFFVNMCGAGAAVPGEGRAMAVEDEHELIDIARRVFRDESFGFKSYAIFPATPRNRNTFEDDGFKSSVFAHHLLEGLAGRAANPEGVVTAGSLFKYLSQQLDEELPRNDGEFAKDITVGVTRRLEGEADYLVGTALLAAARALEPAETGTERAAQRGALLDLAVAQLARVEPRSPDLWPRALLRRTQARLLRGDAVASEDLAVTRAGAMPDPEEAKELKALGAAAGATASVSTLKDLRDALAAGAPFYALVLDWQFAEHDAVRAESDAESQAWTSVFESFPGRREVSRAKLGWVGKAHAGRQTLPASATARVEHWVQTEKAAGHAVPRLVVVYAGSAGLEGPDGTPISHISSTLAAPRLVPFGRPEIDAILERWPGPLTIAYLGPFGGALLTGEPPQREDVSLLLAAREPNGMTFAGGGKASQTTASLVANALRDGAPDPAQYAPLVEFNRQFPSNQLTNEGWVPGTPAWLPNWSGPDSRRIALTQLAPLDRFALLVAADCALERLTACDLKSEDPFARLVVAARQDLEGQSTKAAADYTAVASELQKIASGDGVGLGAAGAQAALGTAAERIARRARGDQSSTGRRVVILRIGVEDYASPLVADLPGTAGDLDAYSRALTTVLASGTARVEVRDVALPKTAAEILASLRAERDALQPQDLLILIYSGRGIEIEGRRYLTPAGVSPHDVAAGAFDVDSVEEDRPSLWSPADLVDLWQVAEIMRERWLVAIYDAQFTPPQLDAERADQILDKHLNSVRVLAEQPEGGWLTARASVFQALPRGEIPPRQLHLWVEGTLTAAARPPNECAQDRILPIASPLASAIVASLPPQAPGTYRDWLASLAMSPCLDNDVGPRLAAQGDLDVPLFASGEAADLVDFFHKELGRRDVNLRAAHAVVESAAERFPTDRNRLAHVVALLALGTLHAEQAESRGLAREFAGWLDEAESLLEDVQFADAGPQEAIELRSLQLELLVRRHVLGGDPEQARKELRAAPPVMLLERGLAERLVALTGEAVRRQPATLVEDTARGLDEAEREMGVLKRDADGIKVKTAKAQLAKLLREEQARRAEHFSIKPPGQSGPPDGEP